MNELRHRFCIGVGEWLWFVVYAPMGPGASFSETPFFQIMDSHVCVCVCVCELVREREALHSV